MNSYGQFCGLAVALDAIGDRWSLLIVRELLISPRRFGELRSALAPIASNLLTSRLRDLEHSGVLTRRQIPDRKAVEYSLTDRGEDLRGAVHALIRWGAETMGGTSYGGHVVRPGWVALAADAFVEPLPGLEAEVEDIGGDEADRLLLTIRPRRGSTGDASTVVEGSAVVVLGTVAGAITPETAAELGARVVDPRHHLRRIRVAAR